MFTVSDGLGMAEVALLDDPELEIRGTPTAETRSFSGIRDRGFMEGLGQYADGMGGVDKARALYTMRPGPEPQGQYARRELMVS